MVKKAFCMKVYPEKQEEYKKRHDELWPEMRTALREHGVIDYSIYLDPSISLLFGYLVIEDEKLWEKWQIHLSIKNGGSTWKISWRQIQMPLQSVGN